MGFQAGDLISVSHHIRSMSDREGYDLKRYDGIHIKRTHNLVGITIEPWTPCIVLEVSEKHYMLLVEDEGNCAQQGRWARLCVKRSELELTREDG